MLGTIKHTVNVLTGNGHGEKSQPILGQHIAQLLECIKNVRATKLRNEARDSA